MKVVIKRNIYIVSISTYLLLVGSKMDLTDIIKSKKTETKDDKHTSRSNIIQKAIYYDKIDFKEV